MNVHVPPKEFVRVAASFLIPLAIIAFFAL